MMYSPKMGPDGENDPCNTYVQIEHSAGCPSVDLVPFLRVLGALMIFCGAVTIYFAEKA